MQIFRESHLHWEPIGVFHQTLRCRIDSGRLTLSQENGKFTVRIQSPVTLYDFPIISFLISTPFQPSLGIPDFALLCLAAQDSKDVISITG